MNRFRNYVLMAAGFGVLALVVGVFSAGPAIAQAVRAALVSNVDDPGRIPYRVAIQMGPDCNLLCRGINQHPVPAGKRLVITNVTGQVSSSAPGGTLLTLDISNGLFSNGFIGAPTSEGIVQIPVIYSGFYNGSSLFGFNQQVLVFYDPGPGPIARLFIGGNGDGGGDVILSGYLLDCTTAPCAALP